LLLGFEDWHLCFRVVEIASRIFKELGSLLAYSCTPGLEDILIQMLVHVILLGSEFSLLSVMWVLLSHMLNLNPGQF